MQRLPGRARYLWLAGAACLLAGLIVACSASAADAILELRAGRDFQGEVRGATYDRQGTTWIATKYQLFRAEPKRVRLIDSAGDNRRLALAPGGGRYAWLDSGGAVFGQFNFELISLEERVRSLGEPSLEQPVRSLGLPHAAGFPDGFAALYLGVEGRLVVAVRPLQDLEGLRGPFGYAFFSSAGELQSTITRLGRRDAVLDESGEAIALIGESDSEAINKGGKSLWKVAVPSGKAALGDRGNTALLSPLERPAEIDVVRHDDITGQDAVTRLDLLAPVHAIAITPDGTRGAVATVAGRISIIDLDRCTAGGCAMRRLPPLPILSVHEISDIRFLDDNTLALGVILATGLRPGARYFGGAVMVITTAGAVRFQRSIHVPVPTTGGPRLDVTFGRQEFTAFTPSTVMVVEVEP